MRELIRSISDDYDEYVNQYFDCIKHLLKSNGDVTLPLIFTYVHLVELVLKSIDHSYDGFPEHWTIEDLEIGYHDILKLISKKEVYEEYIKLDISKDIIDSVPKTILELRCLFNCSDINMSSRYPVDKKNNRIDVENILMNKKEIYKIIEKGTENILIFYLQGILGIANSLFETSKSIMQKSNDYEKMEHFKLTEEQDKGEPKMIIDKFDTLQDNEILLKLNRTCEADPSRDWLPAYYFDICLLDGSKIGNCDLRIGHNHKTYIGGNIGYGIDEEYRGNHYAGKACKLLFKLAKLNGLDYVIITCNITNIASKKTCEYAGGRFIEEAEVPKENEMYAEGLRKVLIYQFDI